MIIEVNKMTDLSSSRLILLGQIACWKKFRSHAAESQFPNDAIRRNFSGQSWLGNRSLMKLERCDSPAPLSERPDASQMDLVPYL